jgi:hypothetical protein
MQMIDLHLPTTGGRELLLTRYTEPDLDLCLLLGNSNSNSPAQPSLKSAPLKSPAAPDVVKTFEGPLERHQSLTSFNLPQSAKIG